MRGNNYSLFKLNTNPMKPWIKTKYGGTISNHKRLTGIDWENNSRIKYTNIMVIAVQTTLIFIIL